MAVNNVLNHGEKIGKLLTIWQNYRQECSSTLLNSNWPDVYVSSCL